MEMVRFCLLLGQHLIELMGFNPEEEITLAFEAMNKWLDGKVNYHEARNLSLQISRIARDEKDIVKVRFLRTIAQIATSPHVKYHGLWATDFAVTLINRMHPSDMDAVRLEREKHSEAVFQMMMLSYNLFLLFKFDYLANSEYRQQIKTFRLKYVFLAAKIIKTARSVIMKLSEKYPYREVYEKCLCWFLKIITWKFAF